jgi:uncharacterized membrane protein YdjX (TVP38/TMEM64 family)
MTPKGPGAAVALAALGIRHTARLVVLALLAIGAVAAWRWRAVLDPLSITAGIERYPAAPLGFLVVQIAASLLFIPRTVLALVAGLLFGLGWGIVWAELGGVAGATAGFLIARYLNAGWIGLQYRAEVGTILERVERGGWRAVAMLRLVPVVPHSVANYGLALTRVPIGAYAFGSLVGQLPMTVAYVELGAAGGRLMLGTGWIEPTLIGLGALSLSLLVPTFARWRAR